MQARVTCHSCKTERRAVGCCVLESARVIFVTVTLDPVIPDRERQDERL